MDEEERSSSQKSLLFRQLSQPLPAKVLGVHSSSDRAGASDGDRAVSLNDDGPSSTSGRVAAKKVSLARLRAFGSIRNAKFAGDADTSGVDKVAEQPSDALSEEQRKRLIDRAIRYFNLNPKVGLKFIREKRLVASKRDPTDVVSKKEALFLKTTRGLNKVKVGQILCSDPVILREYLALFDFASYEPTVLGVERGLREMLASFKPGGEGQQLERIMETFAERFAQFCEPALSKDAVLTIAIMILMLNTSLHNPNNKHGIFRTKEEFVSVMSKEPLVNEAVTEAQLAQLFDNIQREEIRHDDDRDDLAGNLFSDPEYAGWLDVKMYSATALLPRMQARWKCRYVILSQNVMYFFKRSTDVDFKAFVTLENVRLLIDSSYTSSGSTGATPTSSSITTPSAELFHPTTQRLVQKHIEQHREQQTSTVSDPSLHQQDEDKDEKKSKFQLKINRFSSWQSFRTSHSSFNSSSPLNASTTSSSSTFRRFTRPFRSHSPSSNELTFILAPAARNFYVKSARLSKSRKMKRNGELVAQQNLYVAFRTSERVEYTNWVRTLKDSGLLRGKAMVSFYKAISDSTLWTKRSGVSLLLPQKFSLPTSFSELVEIDEETDLQRDASAIENNQPEPDTTVLVVA